MDNPNEIWEDRVHKFTMNLPLDVWDSLKFESKRLGLTAKTMAEIGIRNTLKKAKNVENMGELFQNQISKKEESNVGLMGLFRRQ